MARTIITRETTSEAKRLTNTGADENDRRLADLRPHLGECGSLRAAASAAFNSLPPLIAMQRETAEAIAMSAYASAYDRADAREALRTTVAIDAADRETAIRSQGLKLDEQYVKKIRDRLATDPTTKAKAERLATTAASALRTFGTEIDKLRDELLAPPMDLSIEQIMNIENAKTMWRSKGANMMKEIRAFHMRLVEREQEDEQLILEPVIVSLASEIRDMPPAKLAMRNGNRQPTTTDSDRSIAIELLGRVERMRIARIPEWVSVAAWLHQQFREVFTLLCGWHGRYVGYHEFSQRRQSGASDDGYAIHQSWIFRAHPSTPDAKRGAR